MTNYELVRVFRKQMKLEVSDTPVLLSAEMVSYFSRFILEELSEFMMANECENIVDAADALADLVYVTMGCAQAMGLPFDQIFKVVHEANMRKVIAPPDKRSAFGSQHDCVKPADWQPPEPLIKTIIQKAKENAV